MKTKSREQILIIITVICVGAFIADKIIITPLFTVWESRSQRIEELEQSISQGKTLLSREREIRRRWREMQRDALPETKPQAENLILKALDGWVSGSQINLLSLKPQWIDHEEMKYRTLQFRAVANGSLSELVTFIFALENDPLSIKVDDIELSSQDKNGALLTMEITFSGVKFIPEEEQES